jgi:hypothetical protein
MNTPATPTAKSAPGSIELTDQYNIPGGNNGGETIELVRQCLDMETPGKWARIEPWGPMNAHFGFLKAFNWLLFNCGALVFPAGNPLFPAATALPIQAYPVLAMPGSQTVGTIDGQPGALLWPAGKGKVLLIAGKLGDYDLGKIWGAFDKKDAKGQGVFYPMRTVAQAKVEAALAPFLDAVARWSGVPMHQPLSWDGKNGALLGYYKRNRDVHFVAFLNRGKTPLEPRFAVAGLPAGDYALRRIDPDADARLGHFSAAALAASLTPGMLAPDRMVVIRLERLP